MFSLLFVGLLCCFSLLFFNRIKWAKVLVAIWLGAFLLVSTYYLPVFLAKRMEDRYAVFDPSKIDSVGEYYIVVLGSGYANDHRLPAVGQLAPVTLGRLVEAVRIKQLLGNSYLVCSGGSAFGIATQAATCRLGAMELGVNSADIKMMETPRTTWEEAQAFYQQFGKEKKVILVTDAIHMTRAKSYFEQFGLVVTPAPTNFRVKVGINNNPIKFLPSMANMELLNHVLHEYAGEIKGRFHNRRTEH